MSIRISYRIFFQVILFLLPVIFMAACLPVATRESLVPAEIATPTPEVFNPLDPSPTPSDSTLPLTCQVTDLNVYVNEDWGYCFAYPMDFTTDESRAAEGIILLYGPALEDNVDPIRVSLEVSTQVVPGKSELALLVDAFLASFQDSPWEITREPWLLGSEDAEKLEPVPGLLSSRVIMALHNGLLFTLRFHPVAITMAELDVNALTQTVSGSFAFFPPATQPVSRLQTINWIEFGRNISLSYDSILAPWVEAQTVPSVPVSDQILFAEAHPEYAQIRFLGFQGGRLYDLPLLPLGNRSARVMVFQTADFSGYGDDGPQGFVNQLSALNTLLATGVDPAFCAEPLTGEPALPFLPWINMKQTFCAQAQLIEFQSGRGIRYLSYYAQGPNPVLDREVFYTFQGLTTDGQFYISALFPVETGVFPVEPPACPRCGEPDYDPFAEWTAVLNEQLDRLNAQSVSDFAPSLQLLDDLIKSIHIENS